MLLKCLIGLMLRYFIAYYIKVVEIDLKSKSVGLKASSRLQQRNCIVNIIKNESL